MSETCLWVRDAERRGQNPEPVRCRPNGYVHCRPCLDHFDARTPAEIRNATTGEKCTDE